MYEKNNESQIIYQLLSPNTYQYFLVTESTRKTL